VEIKNWDEFIAGGGGGAGGNDVWVLAGGNCPLCRDVYLHEIMGNVNKDGAAVTKVE